MRKHAQEHAQATAEEAKAKAADYRAKVNYELSSVEALLSDKKKELAITENALRLKSEDARALDVGYYEPVYEFADLEKYQNELDYILGERKRLLVLDPKNLKDKGKAAYSYKNMFETSPTPLKTDNRRIERVLKLMLRAFNYECDSYTTRVTYKNINIMERRIRSAFDQINKLAEPWHCMITTQYLENRIDELRLVYEYEEAKQREKEEQAQIREQIREEEKAEREAQKAQEEAEKEEAKYQEMLNKARLDALIANEKDKEKLTMEITELQRRISEIEERKRAISQAMLTKTGHVYVISNVGSFGEEIFKIGMTRRLDPMDRVKELGDASVPFPFDVHAMIRSSNAPALESALHAHFNERRLNLENERKEFFKVSIDEIKAELELLKQTLGIDGELRLTLLAEAKQFRLSEAKRKHLEASYELS